MQLSLTSTHLYNIYLHIASCNRAQDYCWFIGVLKTFILLVKLMYKKTEQLVIVTNKMTPGNTAAATSSGYGYTEQKSW
jgi:hypothetical protein